MLCRTCCEEIADGAKKCTHCGSFQNYRRFFTISSTALSLLIALLSVSGLVLPNLIDAMKHPEAEVTFTIAHADSDRIWVLAKNAGRTAAILNDVWLIAPGENDEPHYLHYTVVCFGRSNGYLEPGMDNLIIMAAAGHHRMEQPAPYYSSNEYRVRGFFSSTSGIRGSVDLTEPRREAIPVDSELTVLEKMLTHELWTPEEFENEC